MFVTSVKTKITNMPRLCAGASSLLKNGVIAEEMPTATPETTRATYSSGSVVQKTWARPPTTKMAEELARARQRARPPAVWVARRLPS